MMGYSEEDTFINNVESHKEMVRATVSTLSQMVEGMIADSSWDILSSTPSSSSSSNFFHTNFSLNEELFVANNESYDLGTTDSPDHSHTSGEIATHPLNWGNVALVCVFCSIIAGTVGGNTLVIAAVLTTRRLRTVTNCFVMSLAVADWLVGVFVMPPKIVLHLSNNHWSFGPILCEMWISLDILLCTASILSLCAISIDRYLAITRPLAYSRRRRSKRLALSMISCVWVAAIVITCPPIFGWYEENRNVEHNCDYNSNTGYVVYSALGSFFLPLLVMIYVYARIACVIARRQHSIMKLHNSSDRKSQCYGGGGGSDETVEPLQHEGSFERTSKMNSPPAIVTNEASPAKYSTEGNLEANRPHPPSTTSTATFWQRIRLIKSCTTGEDETSSLDNGATKRSSNGQKGGSSDSDSNSASGIAISLPDPATLSGVGVTGNGPGGSTNDSLSARSPSTCSSPGTLAIQGGSSSVQGTQSHTANPRLRTGSRLCHHSVATASPQRNIHRVHQTTSSTTRLFVDNDGLQLESPRGLSPLSKSTPRVWTVEETGLCSAGRSSKSGSPGERFVTGSGSLGTTRECGKSPRFNGTSSSLSIPMNNTPAGNPASLMSSPNVGTSSTATGPQKCDKNLSSTSSRHRIYHPQPSSSYGDHLHHPHHHPHINSNSIHRGRSIKLTLNLHENDHNQNGGIAREFSSGRVASFKRETKTAQTLAAVVGGFIICWLPFFVAYVVFPFLTNPEDFPITWMEAFIWLGWSNSTINPFIYAFYSPDFRNAFWRLTVRKCNNLFRNRNSGRRSPRRFDDHNNTQSRVSG